ncbi:MAG: hypothetical protein IPO03_02315 [Bacteroidetes bacterium]|nr:hypothetical protein [Bacteroidota bacterium]
MTKQPELINCNQNRNYSGSSTNVSLSYLHLTKLAGTRNYGDWGGIIILGEAPINVAGGSAVIEGGVDTPEGDGIMVVPILQITGTLQYLEC